MALRRSRAGATGRPACDGERVHVARPLGSHHGLSLLRARLRAGDDNPHPRLPRYPGAGAAAAAGAALFPGTVRPAGREDRVRETRARRDLRGRQRQRDAQDPAPFGGLLRLSPRGADPRRAAAARLGGLRRAGDRSLKLRSGPRLMGAALLAVCVLLIGLESPPVAALRETLFDGYQRLMPRVRSSAPAIIVDIDERSLDTLGQWPWPRSVTADLVRAISRAGPAAIGVDVLFVEPDRSVAGADAALAQALQGGKVVLGIAGIDYRDRRFPHPPHVAPVLSSGRRELSLRQFDGQLQSRP